MPTNKEHHGNHKAYGLKREQKNSLDNERYLLKKWVWRQDLKTSNRYPKHRKYRGNARLNCCGIFFPSNIAVSVGVFMYRFVLVFRQMHLKVKRFVQFQNFPDDIVYMQ